ncbi:pilus assembly protein [Novosphingobium sp. SL115]|uniref:TadE/TadG family type IV pilus assembly protein n=1 Tax=Novosphingobium sp. SL115 TaxID=2995150 RepID=UPI0022744204|nr:TadE family protein [Novosphingobium sp. SL115]MCY1671183.1 pilus assembly protein [Novosphingobium sp. SL115]
MRASLCLFRRIVANANGATVVEFALVAPMFLVFLFSLLDVGQMVYGKAILTGAVQRAARASALETRDTSAADTMVFNTVKGILPGLTRDKMITSRISYSEFSDVGRPEQWNDANGSGTCDGNETYVDENRSGQWDADIGRQDDQGSANDVVVYSVEAHFSPLFKVPFLPQQWSERTLSARTVIKNQPFGNQVGYGSTTGSCAT